MTKKKKTFDFEKNSIQEYSVRFLGGHVSFDGNVLPVGQVSTEILNLSNETRQALYDASSKFAGFLTGQFVDPQIKKDGALAKKLHERVNQVQDILFQIPPYKHMKMDQELASMVWTSMYDRYPNDFRKMFIAGTPENTAVNNYINSILNVLPEIIEFREKVNAMLEVYFEPLQKRNAAEYAAAAHAFIEAGRMLDDFDVLLQGRSIFKLEQTRRTMVEYIPMPNPDAPEEYIISEQMVFHSIAEFLHMDLFRALINGNVPRRCHNCGTFFLLTSGYNTCYCNNVAPGETERTCRKVGAHKKEKAEKGRSPIVVEYDRVYNRLKTRKNRGKISADEWNEAVAKVLELKDKAERGEINEIQLREIYDKI